MARLHFRYSCINAGKSTYLLQVAHNYHENGTDAVLYTSGLDDRYGVGIITSRIGLQQNAKIYTPDSDFNQLLADTKASCILIDEAQFLTAAQVKQLHKWAHSEGIPVMCFGLRSDFKGEPFPGSAALLTLADNIEEIKTVCKCGKRATMNIRMNSLGERITEGEQVLIGGNSVYRQVCAKCFYAQ